MEIIGRYKILRRLGSGGFGEVWLGHDAVIDRDVAIKVFNPKDENLIAFATSSDTEGLDTLRARFVNEARILGSLEANPFVINVLDFGELKDGSPYYVMPYLPNSLTDLLGKDIYDTAAIEELEEHERPRALPLEQALSVLEQLLVGLSGAHEKGLVHRDIKPSNIMLTTEGEVRIVDFGIAKAPEGQHSTVSQLGMGSRNYMAPEQRESAKHVDARADVYAVGTLAYRLLTGRLPTGRYSDPNVAVPQLHQGINDLIIECLNEDKDQRIADATQLLQRFNKVRSQQGEVSEETGTWVSSNESTLRDELKPLRSEIDNMLNKSVEITTADFQKLEIMAAVVDLDEGGLRALIQSQEEAMGSSLGIKRNFLQLVDKTLSQGALSDEARATLFTASEPTGWAAEEVTEIIRQREPALAPAPPSPITSEPVSRRAPYTIAGMVLITVIAGGVWWFTEQDPPAQPKVASASVNSSGESSAQDEHYPEA